RPTCCAWPGTSTAARRPRWWTARTSGGRYRPGPGTCTARERGSAESCRRRVADLVVPVVGRAPAGEGGDGGDLGAADPPVGREAVAGVQAVRAGRAPGVHQPAARGVEGEPDGVPGARGSVGERGGDAELRS